MSSETSQAASVLPLDTARLGDRDDSHLVARAAVTCRADAAGVLDGAVAAVELSLRYGLPVGPFVQTFGPLGRRTRSLAGLFKAEGWCGTEEVWDGLLPAVVVLDDGMAALSSSAAMSWTGPRWCRCPSRG